MTFKSLTLSAAAIAFISACGQVQETAQNAAKTATDTASQAGNAAVQTVKDTAKDVAAKALPGADISGAPSGVYESQDAHAYITFQYLHQGFSRPILRWNAFDATLNLDADNPAASTLSVNIEADSIDSGVEKFDDHLLSADFFDAETYPEITFVSKTLTQGLTGHGTLTGDLTMKGITKPVTLDVTLNKVGEDFRSKTPMIGISATAALKRSDWDLGLYTPNVGDDVNINIEVEFAKKAE